MKMGKVIEKLQGRPEVASLTDGGDCYVVLLATGYASDGKTELRAKTAHEARLFIDAASNGTEKTRRAPKLRIIREDGTEEVIAAETPKFKPVRYGPPCPLWKRDRNYNANEMWGRQAFLQGHPRDCNPFGDSSAGKEFDAAWLAAQRAAERDKARRVIDDGIGDAGEVDMFLAEQAMAA